MTLDRTALARAIAENGPLTRVVIAAHAGSTPRETGTAMLVWASGQSGTIGGGTLEHEATRLARAHSAERPRLVTQPLGPALGQCCGGSVTLLLEHYVDVAEIPESGAFARPVSPDAPPDPPLALARALGVARQGTPIRAALHDGWFIEPLSEPRTQLWLYGAGHVGRAIAATLSGLPVDTTWIDTAPDRFPDTLPEGATRLVAANPAQAVAHAPSEAHHLVMTFSHALDLEVCHAVVSRRFASLGLIGSATKRARFLKRLSDLGHPPERLARLTCPIGNRALGKHPQAIAVGVVHRLLKDQAAHRSGVTNRDNVA
ncbi:xanthine dehydrogenase accessory protein XdhC [Oceanibium sediminis]|uniref:xanthine dehydrogenase accessory protein XdhC n=1 Tax=Oceanibium sediminis TaxID=2026339 RepID=UPI001E33985A|nr:xanthine dehydrogenase accessory protein XdhC [Oceanibium sediminis]